MRSMGDVSEMARLLPRGVKDCSGGEAKRIAFARAVVTPPRLLLPDEPLAGLDRRLHARVIEFLIRVRDELRVPMIYVTHDPAELQSIVFETILIDRGRVTSQQPAGGRVCRENFLADAGDRADDRLMIACRQ